MDEQLQEDVEQLDEAPMSPQAKAAQKHIEDLAKKHKKSFGDMRMHVDDYPSKHDQKTRDAAKALNKHQYGGWKKGSDGKMTQEEVEQVNEADEYCDCSCKCDNEICESCGKPHRPVEEAKATDCGRCGTKHVAPKDGGTCPAVKEEAELDEKTLTPAEKKKREDVAKAIERDNPDMPMDKKMAIATATAKKVAESSISDRTRSLIERAINRKT